MSPWLVVRAAPVCQLARRLAVEDEVWQIAVGHKRRPNSPLQWNLVRAPVEVVPDYTRQSQADCWGWAKEGLRRPLREVGAHTIGGWVAVLFQREAAYAATAQLLAGAHVANRRQPPEISGLSAGFLSRRLTP